jgi:hypothetical protein
VTGKTVRRVTSKRERLGRRPAHLRDLHFLDLAGPREGLHLHSSLPAPRQRAETPSGPDPRVGAYPRRVCTRSAPIRAPISWKRVAATVSRAHGIAEWLLPEEKTLGSPFSSSEAENRGERHRASHWATVNKWLPSWSCGRHGYGGRYPSEFQIPVERLFCEARGKLGKRIEAQRRSRESRKHEIYLETT